MLALRGFMRFTMRDVLVNQPAGACVGEGGGRVYLSPIFMFMGLARRVVSRGAWIPSKATSVIGVKMRIGILNVFIGNLRKQCH